MTTLGLALIVVALVLLLAEAHLSSGGLIGAGAIAAAIGGAALLLLAAAAFVGIFFLNVPFPIIVFGAAFIGFAAQTMGVTAFQGGGGHGRRGARAR